jgi:predicted ATP-grasp superfamily ATP-dependent carboligase
MKVLVTDGENRAALAITRSLGRANHCVVVGEQKNPSLAQRSRYCSESITYPDPTVAEDQFIESLLATVRDRSVDVLLPVSDVTTMIVTENRKLFEPRCRIPFAEAGIVRRAADKVLLLETAKRMGVPIPDSRIVADRTDLVIDDLSFPIVIKPHQSRVRAHGLWRSCKVSYARNRDELLRDVDGRHPYEFPLILQEWIVGPGQGIFCCYHNSQLIAQFSHTRLREKPPWGGVSVLSESAPMCPRTLDYAQRLLGELGWEGVAMVEFKRDTRCNISKLMEINGRFWGSLQLAIDAGVDFPRILVETTEGRAPTPVTKYRIGVQSRWFWGDVDALLVRLLTSEVGPVLEDKPGKLACFLEFWKLWGANLRYENPRLSDLRPWLHETAHWIKRSATRLSAGRSFEHAA